MRENNKLYNRWENWRESVVLFFKYTIYASMALLINCPCYENLPLQEFLIKIFKGAIESERSNLFFSVVPSERLRLKQSCSFGPIEDQNQVSLCWSVLTTIVTLNQVEQFKLLGPYLRVAYWLRKMRNRLLVLHWSRWRSFEFVTYLVIKVSAIHSFSNMTTQGSQQSWISW